MTHTVHEVQKTPYEPKRFGILVGGFSESAYYLDPFANALVLAGVYEDVRVMTAGEYRRTPPTNKNLDEASLIPHSAGIIAVAEHHERDPRGFIDAQIVALNAVNPTGLIRQVWTATQIGVLGREKIEKEDGIPEDLQHPKWPAQEMFVDSRGTSLWIPRKVRGFSSVDYLSGIYAQHGYSAGRIALWGDNDLFPFTPDQDALNYLNSVGVHAFVREGAHNEDYYRPENGANVIKQAYEATARS